LYQKRLPKVEGAKRPKKETDRSRIAKCNLLGTYGQKCVLGSSKTGGFLNPKAGEKSLCTKPDKQRRTTFNRNVPELSQKPLTYQSSVKKQWTSVAAMTLTADHLNNFVAFGMGAGIT
jgi:hypothetical protein